MTSPIWLVAFLFLLNIANIHSVPKSYYTRGAKWPADNITPFPYETNGPINILTSDVEVLSNLKPLRNLIYVNEKITVQNIGDKVEILLGQKSTKSLVSGGPLKNDKYSFFGIRFFWNHDYRQGVTGGLDDRKSSPLFVTVIFYNSKYGSFNESLSRRDGVAIIYLQVKVQGHIPNPGFTPLEKTLKKLITPGNSITMLCGAATGFLVYGSEFYYTYPSVYVSNEGKYYYSATSIVPKTQPWISIDQFASFLALKNNQSSPVDARVPSFLHEPYRPVIQTPILEQILK